MDGLSKLPVGTKLMWDAPNVYLTGSKIGCPIICPAIIVGHSEKNPLLGALIAASIHNKQYMGNENEYLRFPTENELKTLSWDF